ncbi:hypothetical protein [Enterobacter cloacae]|uniref:hypothetical protein n=1 Tax=Enterobacter cloacae TaxID=550 RepID=UPI002A83D5ED|nr:hypothetical protein [Enterobacter cloacae]
MSTITKGFTKEQLIARINQVTAINKYRISRDPDADGLAMDNELLAIALASPEAEAVACPKCNGTGMADSGGVQPWGEPISVPCDCTAQPALAVDADDNFYSWFGREWHEHYQQNQYTTAAKQMLGVMAESAWKAGRRSAMLQGAEPVTTAYKLRDAVETIRNSGIEIDAEKIFAERDALNAPDCWCRTCRPITPTDMRFVVCPDCGNKRCPHANDHRNACTGSNEPGQEGSAYPAAPHQEANNG